MQQPTTYTFTLSSDDANLLYAAAEHFKTSPKSAYDNATVGKILGDNADKNAIATAYSRVCSTILNQASTQILT